MDSCGVLHRSGGYINVYGNSKFWLREAVIVFEGLDFLLLHPHEREFVVDVDVRDDLARSGRLVRVTGVGETTSAGWVEVVSRVVVDLPL